MFKHVNFSMPLPAAKMIHLNNNAGDKCGEKRKINREFICVLFD